MTLDKSLNLLGPQFPHWVTSVELGAMQNQNEYFWQIFYHTWKLIYFSVTIHILHSITSLVSRKDSTDENITIKNEITGASLVAQWLRICLPMQGTRVRALVWEDPTCCGATRPVSHNYWACASGACAPQQERPW